jgi:hypothetical protein
MEEQKDIRDDQIRIIGEEVRRKPKLPRRWRLLCVVFLVVGIFVALLMCQPSYNMPQQATHEPSYFEPIQEEQSPTETSWEVPAIDSLTQGFTEIRDTLINDIPLKIFIPHNAQPSLHLGKIDSDDSSIILAAQAADVRADNGGIVGAFVMKGELLARGLSKKGFCAIINGAITIGVAENSPLLEKATETSGYFFRQFPLVSNGILMENNPKGKSIRRGLCALGTDVFIVETGSPESFHDFAQALVDLGVHQAVYLVGSSAFGWAVDKQGEKHRWGLPHLYSGRVKVPENTSYIVWKRKG